MTEIASQLNGHAQSDEDTPDVALLKTALLARLDAILKKPFTARMLLELENAARLSQQFLMITKDPRVGRRGGGGNYFGGVQMSNAMMNMGEDLYDLPGGGITNMPNPMRAETFGATAVREIVSGLGEVVAAMKTPKVTAPELVTAISVARAQGMTDVVTGLEAKLQEMLAPPPEVESIVKQLSASGLAMEGSAHHEHG